MEKIYTSQVTEISSLIQQAGFDDSDYMLLEKIDVIKFEKFKPETFEGWEKGIIFSKNKEFKWRKIDNSFYIVFSGEDIPEPKDFNNFTNAEIEENDFPVILWGQRSEKMTDFPPNQYIELPIPIKLEYPIESDFRIKIKLKIQKNDKGNKIGYRFSGIEEVHHESV